jgi:hypothetical protein
MCLSFCRDLSISTAILGSRVYIQLYVELYGYTEYILVLLYVYQGAGYRYSRTAVLGTAVEIKRSLHNLHIGCRSYRDHARDY